MFICPICKSPYQVPSCVNCAYTPTCTSGIYQLTEDPDIVTGGEGDKYIGYEHIGESYSGNRKHTLEHQYILFANEVSRLTASGIFLDLGCGDGCITVPTAKNGTKIIAADISNKMLQTLKAKALHNNISLENVTLCRMNALNLNIADNTATCAISNSVLHLISRPEKVIREIHRILKPGGYFVFKNDSPGTMPDSPFDNSKYNKIVNEIYSSYWKHLAKHNVHTPRNIAGHLTEKHYVPAYSSPKKK